MFSDYTFLLAEFVFVRLATNAIQVGTSQLASCQCLRVLLPNPTAQDGRVPTQINLAHKFWRIISAIFVVFSFFFVLNFPYVACWGCWHVFDLVPRFRRLNVVAFRFWITRPVSDHSRSKRRSSQRGPKELIKM